MPPKKFTTQTQRHVAYARKQMRQIMEKIALSHRGCSVGRGCGCLVDLSLGVLADAEAALFQLEIDSYSAPTTPKRQVNYDNSIDVVTSEAPMCAVCGERSVQGHTCAGAPPV